MSDDEKFTINQRLGLQILAWVVAVLLAYGAMNTRVSLVENRVDQIQQDLKDIKADVKQLLRRP